MRMTRTQSAMDTCQAYLSREEVISFKEQDRKYHARGKKAETYSKGLQRPARPGPVTKQ